MSKISDLRQQLIAGVEKDLVELDRNSVIPGKWGIPDLRMSPVLVLAVEKWVDAISIWIKKMNTQAVKNAEFEHEQIIKRKSIWKVTKKLRIICKDYSVRRVTWVKSGKEYFEPVKIAFAVNSGYRPSLLGVKGDKHGYTDLRDPRGHWSGLSIDIGIKETAEWLWGSNAFNIDYSKGNKEDQIRYKNLKSDYKNILIKSAYDAGLDRVFLSKGEWWHFSFSDKRARKSNFIWRKYYERGNNGIRPKSNIRHMRWDLATTLNLV